MPSDMEVDIDCPPVSITDQSECPAGSGLRSSGESSCRVTVTLMGCVEGTATVRLLASGDRHELDTLAITIMSNGTLTPADPVVGTIINATLNDPDDPVANSKTWGWERSPDGISWSGVYGATNSSYTVAEEDRGKHLRAAVTYDDDHGSGKRAASAPVEISEGCSVRSLGTITGTEEVSGNWASDCQSVNRTDRYARFYSSAWAQHPRCA